ncbi:MAG TPA: type II CAAX endopeptidase family protein [Gemmatimonadaceae bacterium]|jgi:membrane protease YdiL (CAAX protease family)
MTHPPVRPINAIPETTSTQDPIRTREVSWPIIALFLVVSSGVLVLLPVLRRAAALREIFEGPIWRANVFVFAALLLIAVVGVVFGLGRLRPADVGLRRDKLGEGMIVTVAVWSLMQLVEVVGDIVTTSKVSIAPSWIRNGIGSTLAWTAAMFLGAALYEEIAYRGFLFPQLYLKIRGTHRARFWIALLLSQVVFAASHIPAHITLRNLSGSALWTTVVLQGIIGVLLVLLYLRTRNLWISIGIHGLANAPTPLVAGASGFETFLIILVIGWPWIARRPQHRRLARVEPAI